MSQGFDPYHQWLGIPPEDQPPDSYRLLGVKRFETDLDVISTAADRQMGHLRSFQTGKHSDFSQRLLNEVASAKICLLNPGKKAAYDRQLLQQSQGAAEAVPNSGVLPPQGIKTASVREMAFDQFVSEVVHTPATPAPDARPPRTMATGIAIVVATTIVFTGIGVWLSVNRRTQPRGEASREAAFVKGTTEEGPAAAIEQPRSHPKPATKPPAFPRRTDAPPSIPSASIKNTRQPRSSEKSRTSSAGLPVTEDDLPTPGLIVKPIGEDQESLHSHDTQANSYDRKRMGSFGKFTKTPAASRVEHMQEIRLPSGSVLSEAVVGIPDYWRNKLFPSDAAIYVGKYPTDAIDEICAYDQGKLDGPAAKLYEDGRLCRLASYTSGMRDGPLRVWDAESNKVLYAEYKRGKKNGIVCYFSGGKPLMIEEWDKGRLSTRYSVKYNDGTPVPAVESGLEEEEKAQLFKASCESTALEAKIDEQEGQMKKRLLDWYHKEDLRIKRERVTQLVPERRAAARDRSQARRDADAGAMGGAWQAALRRSGL